MKNQIILIIFIYIILTLIAFYIKEYFSALCFFIVYISFLALWIVVEIKQNKK